MPSFNVNLIFVAKIIRDVNYVVVFYADSYLIQDWSLKKTIRVGRLDDGLFVVNPFLDTHKCSQVTFSSNPTLWHQHLGHPSFSHFKLFSKYIFGMNPFVETWMCKVHPLAKQTCFTFLLSNKKIYSSFWFDSLQYFGKNTMQLLLVGLMIFLLLWIIIQGVLGN